MYHIILCTYYGNLVNEDDEKEQDMEMETRVEKGGQKNKDHCNRAAGCANLPDLI